MLVFKYVLTKVMKRSQYVLMMWSLKFNLYAKPFFFFQMNRKVFLFLTMQLKRLLFCLVFGKFLLVSLLALIACPMCC